MAFYHLKDIDKIGKIEDYVPYVFDGSNWVVDNDNSLMDRLIGYDGDSIGSTDDMQKITPISEDEVNKIINK